MRPRRSGNYPETSLKPPNRSAKIPHLKEEQGCEGAAVRFLLFPRGIDLLLTWNQLRDQPLLPRAILRRQSQLPDLEQDR